MRKEKEVRSQKSGIRRLLIVASILFFGIAVNAQKVEPKDTTKKAEPVYVLVGNLPDFQLLFKAVTTHDDVTPNELKALAAWIQRLQQLPADSTKKK